jgi:hypothetical protein
VTDPRVDPHGTTPGNPFTPSGSPAGTPAAGSATSGWPGRQAVAPRAPSDAVPSTPPPPVEENGASPDEVGRARPAPRTQALPRSAAVDDDAAPVTGTFEPPNRPTRPPPRAVPPPPGGAASRSSTGSAYATQTVAPARRRPAGSRKARLRLTRIDPWSALKTSLVFSGFLFIVWMVAVIVLFLVLTAVGTFDSINSTLSDVLGTHVDFNGGVIIGIALVIGAFSVVLVSALGTVVAFAYNVTASLIGGVDVTLTESEQ